MPLVISYSNYLHTTVPFFVSWKRKESIFLPSAEKFAAEQYLGITNKIITLHKPY